MNGQTDSKRSRQKESEVVDRQNREAERLTDRQIDRQTDRQTDRQLKTETENVSQRREKVSPSPLGKKGSKWSFLLG